MAMPWPLDEDAAVMGLLSPHRRFRNPDNMEGIPAVRIHGPAFRRDKPLPGTKGMLTPVDGSLKKLLDRAVERTEPSSRAAKVLGILAVAGAAGLLCLLLLYVGAILLAVLDHLLG